MPEKQVRCQYVVAAIACGVIASEILKYAALDWQIIDGGLAFYLWLATPILAGAFTLAGMAKPKPAFSYLSTGLTTMFVWTIVWFAIGLSHINHF